MTFAKWLSLSEAERAAEERAWYPFEPGYWHSLAVEAAARFSAEFGSKPHITKVFKSLYKARELIVAVQTDLSPAQKVKLPPSPSLPLEMRQFAIKRASLSLLIRVARLSGSATKKPDCNIVHEFTRYI